jgi:hypothetical protein
MRSFGGRYNNSSKSVLNSLEAIERVFWEAFEERIAIVELSGD